MCMNAHAFTGTAKAYFPLIEQQRDEWATLKLNPNAILLLHDARTFRGTNPDLFLHTPRGWESTRGSNE